MPAMSSPVFMFFLKKSGIFLIGRLERCVGGRIVYNSRGSEADAEGSGDVSGVMGIVGDSEAEARCNIPILGITSTDHHLDNDLFRAGLWDGTIHDLDLGAFADDSFLHPASV